MRPLMIRPSNLIRLSLVTLALLSVPLALTLADPTSELRGGDGGGWNWTLADFIIMGILIFATGLMMHVAWTSLDRSVWRCAVAAAVFVVGVLVWAELAIGIFT